MRTFAWTNWLREHEGQSWDYGPNGLVCLFMPLVCWEKGVTFCQQFSEKIMILLLHYVCRIFGFPFLLTRRYFFSLLISDESLKVAPRNHLLRVGKNFLDVHPVNLQRNSGVTHQDSHSPRSTVCKKLRIWRQSYINFVFTETINYSKTNRKKQVTFLMFQFQNEFFQLRLGNFSILDFD